jgi:TPP-dependent indolepyruvate ferredoxin oxidoreductase alpha subunit
MTKSQLIKAMENMDEDKIVIISDGQTWSYVETVLENYNIVIIFEKNPIFK